MMNGLVCCYYDVLVCGGLSFSRGVLQRSFGGTGVFQGSHQITPPILAGCEMIGAFDKRDPN